MPVPTNMPSHAKTIFEHTMEALKGKTNKRTGKPYTDEERAKIAWNAVKNKYKRKAEGWELKSIPEDDWEFCFNSEPLEFKSQDGNYYFSGYLSTFDLDLVNDIVTPQCMNDMLEQVKMGMNGVMRSFKGSPDHDVYWQDDPQLKPISRIVDAQLDNKGIKINGMFNKAHPDFNWNEIQNGFYDGLSIEFRPEEFAFKDVGDKKVRVLNKVQLKGYGHTPRPANPFATLTDCFIKSLEVKDAEDVMEEESIKKTVVSHLEKDIKEYEGMIADDHDLMKKLEMDCNIKQEDDIDDEEENESAKAEIKSEVKIMEEKTEIKAEPQPTPKTENKQEKPETVEEKKAEVKAVDLKALTDEIKAIVKEELKNLIPEKKDLPNTEDKFEEAKSLDLVGYVAKQLGVK